MSTAPPCETNMVFPDIAACVHLMDEYGMLNNIRHHSLVVARVADALVTGLEDEVKPGSMINRKLTIAGSLLHDIAKTPCLNGKCDHAAKGAEICRHHGYEDIAGIVAEHVILRKYDPGRYKNGLFTAGEIVYYADKRVRHAAVVTLEERLDYILKHYGNNDPHRHALIRENFEQCRYIEKYLFAVLPFNPDQLEKRVRSPQPSIAREYDPWS